MSLLTKGKPNAQIDDTFRAIYSGKDQAVGIGFSAITYDWGGRTIVVYRGTDDGGAKTENLKFL